VALVGRVSVRTLPARGRPARPWGASERARAVAVVASITSAQWRRKSPDECLAGAEGCWSGPGGRGEWGVAPVGVQDNARVARRFPRARRNAPAPVGVAPISAGGNRYRHPRAASVGRAPAATPTRPAGALGLFIRSGVGRAATEGGIAAARSCDAGCEASASQGNSGCKRGATQATTAYQRQHVSETCGDPCRVSRDEVPRRRHDTRPRTTRDRTMHDAGCRCGNYPGSAGRRPGDRMRPARAGAMIGRRVVIQFTTARCRPRARM
jgi:hypothetical protein